MRIWVALAAACALLVGGTPASAEPRVFGGSVAVGNPIVVGTAYLTGNLYRICSASVWRPRILLTAAHCVTEENTGALIDPPRVRPTNSWVGP
jgi:secreted trypsin-like serine protease